MTCLEYGVYEKAGFIVITGEIGTGKTTLLRFILRSLDKDLPIALLDQTFLPPEDFLRTLCQEFSLPYEAKEKSELIEIFGPNRTPIAKGLLGKKVKSAQIPGRDRTNLPRHRPG